VYSDCAVPADVWRVGDLNNPVAAAGGAIVRRPNYPVSPWQAKRIVSRLIGNFEFVPIDLGGLLHGGCRQQAPTAGNRPGRPRRGEPVAHSR
jgi:hypothetical protein